MHQRTRHGGLRWLKAAAFGVAIGIAGAIFSLTPPGIAFEEAVGLRWLFLLRGPVTPPDEVAVVALDKRSAASLGLPAQPGKWPRTVQAQVIEAIDRAGASAIAVDLMLSERRRRADDAALATAIAEAGRVVLFRHLERENQQMLVGATDPPDGLRLERTLAPIPEFSQAAAAVAPFPLPKVGAGVRQFWTFPSASGGAPTMPAVTLQLHALEAYQQWINNLEGTFVIEIGQVPFLAGGLRGRLTEVMQATRGTASIGPGSDLVLPSGGDSALLKAIAGLYAGPNSYYLNFYGPPGTIPVIPFAALLSPQQGAPVDLTGKAVFVGVAELNDADQPDGFYSVFTRADGVDLSGVEIAATAFANLLTRRMIDPPSAPVVFGLLTVTGFGLGLLAAGLPAVIAIPSVLAGAATYALAAQAAFNRSDAWLPLATPLLVQLPLALLLGILAQYIVAQRQRRQIAKTISYYLPEKVAQGLQDGASLGPGDVGETVYATCLASDLENFTSLAETMTPKAVADYLNSYFAAIAEPIKRQGADVLEFRADGLMCAWTGDGRRDSVSARACTAALDVMAAAQGLNAMIGDARPPTRLGIHAGWIFVGHTGGGGRYAYSIIGDIANTASRIEGLNKLIGTSLLVSDTVAAALDDFVVRPVGQFLLRGKLESIGIVEIMARRSHATASMLALSAGFSEALAEFRAGRWDRAAAKFAALARDHHGDGPSVFYRDRCLSLASAQVAEPFDPTIIRVEAK